MIQTYLPDRVTVVGGTGHTGERLCRRLSRMGTKVHVLTRFPEGPIAKQLTEEGCKIFEGDCLRRWTLWEAMEGTDAVISCAPLAWAEVLVQACYRLGIERLTVMSSTRRFSHVESETVNQVLAGEATIVESDLEWTIIRPAMIFGGRRDNNLTKVLNIVRRSHIFPVFGDGLSQVQPVFVEDVVTALMETLRRPNTCRRDYTVAGPEPMDYNQMIEQIARACDREVRLLHIPSAMGIMLSRIAGPIVRRYGVTEEAIRRMSEDKVFSIDEAHRELNFIPKSFFEAIQMKARGLAEIEALYPSRNAILGASGTEQPVAAAGRADDDDFDDDDL